MSLLFRYAVTGAATTGKMRPRETSPRLASIASARRARSFGPARVAFVTALQLSLIMEIAVVFKANLKSDRARGEVFEVLGYSNGADTVNIASRAGPKLFARVAEKILAKKGLTALGRALPVVAAPVV